MACLDMFNTTDHQSLCAPPPMSPRISFSNDFVDPDYMIKHERAASTAPISSDFEFSVTNYSMIAADEIFFKGRLLPAKDTCANQLQKMTLRDELLHADDWEDEASPRPPKAPTRWKELLGLKKNHHIGAKKHDKGDGSLERTVVGRPPVAASGHSAQVSKAVPVQVRIFYDISTPHSLFLECDGL